MSAGSGPEWTIYTLAPKSAFNLGPRDERSRRLVGLFPSDSLFSALSSQLREVCGVPTLARLLAEFAAGDPPFLVSGLFPQLGAVRLLPRPVLLPHCSPGLPQRENGARQSLSLLAWVSWEVYRAWVEGEALPAADSLATAQAGAILLTHAELQDAAAAQALVHAMPPTSTATHVAAWHEGPRIRTATGRDGRGVRTFTRPAITFAPGTSLYLIIVWRREEWREVIEQTIAAMGDSGIGADRNVGCGHFAVRRVEAVAAPSAAAADGLVTLALLCPTSAEINAGLLDHPGAAWALVERGGQAASPEMAGRRRKRVTMLAPGSVVHVPHGSHQPLGQLVDVTPDPAPAHKVWRYGWAFGWPLRLPSAATAPPPLPTMQENDDRH